ncbi:MAG: hypothetical protein GF384_00270 [Elusimicrobia bacterium]|nr:hypothetical protein [Elusimicrobiota bacterium]MBD3411531.1 hypothetical protein [Elusimicrobiota bacterium]
MFIEPLLGTNLLVGFIVFIGAVLVIYPVALHLDQTWPFVLISGFFIGLSILVIRDIHSVNDGGLFMFFLSLGLAIGGMAIAGVILGYLFHTRNQWLYAQPSDRSKASQVFNHDAIHLRDIFNAGIKIEEKGMRIYELCAQTTNDMNLKRLCRYLAAEEMNHRDAIMKVLRRWLPRKQTNQVDMYVHMATDTFNIFKEPLPESSTDQKIITYALQHENAMADFYRELADLFPDEWKRMNINWIIAEERSHIEKLNELKRNFSDPHYAHTL